MISVELFDNKKFVEITYHKFGLRSTMIHRADLSYDQIKHHNQMLLEKLVARLDKSIKVNMKTEIDNINSAIEYTYRIFHD